MLCRPAKLRSPKRMAGAAIEQALARIEAALDRVEAAAAKPAGDGDLAQRHERLRAAVTQTLGQLDELLAGQRT